MTKYVDCEIMNTLWLYWSKNDSEINHDTGFQKYLNALISSCLMHRQYEPNSNLNRVHYLHVSHTISYEEKMHEPIITEITYHVK